VDDVTLYLGDCLDILPTLGRVDAVVTDPPYGIDESRKASRRTANAKPDERWRGRVPTNYTFGTWDDERKQQHVDLALVMTQMAIVWGGNYYDLPPASKWLVWDKCNGASDFADCELAWTNIGGATRLFRWLWNGFQKEKPEDRVHPTQKPIALMEWCLSFLPADITVLDPFMGSGTTGVACVRTGRRFIGIEIDPGYFAIAERRIREAQLQPPLLPNNGIKLTRTEAFRFEDDSSDVPQPVA